MKKFTLSLIAGVLSLCCAPFAQATDVPAGETDITTLDWVNKGQDCTSDFNNENGGTVFGTDAGGANLSYVDLSDYGVIKLYGTPGQTARLFLNRAEFGDNGIFFIDIDEDGVATFDCNTIFEKQPLAQYIHLNGVKASAWNTHLNLSMITATGESIEFPSNIPTLGDGEIDITTLEWINKGQGRATNFGAATDLAIFGTDAGPADGQLSYVDITNYGTLKVYGKAGDVIRFFINRAEFPENNQFQFSVTIADDGIGVFNIAQVYANQPGVKYVHLNGVKGNWGATPLVYLIGLIEKDFEAPEGETDIITLPWVNEAQNCDNRMGQATDATIYGTHDAANGEGKLSYVDATQYGYVKLYGSKGDVVRFFINRAENPDNFQFYVTIGEDGVGTLNLADVYTTQHKAEYVHINGIKAQSSFTPKVKGITLSGQKSLFAIHTTGTLTDEHGVNHIAKNGDVWAANLINLDESCEYKLDMDVLAAEVNYLREVTSNRWSTICLPFAVPYTALTGYDVLKLKGIEGDAVVFEYLDETEGMDDHTPYLIRTDSNKLEFNLTGEVTIKASGDAIANGTGVQLVGIYKAQRVPEGCYALASGEFHKAAATNENELKPYRAYLETVSSKQMLKVAINGGTSAIVGIEVAEDAQDGVFYNLKGQKVNNPTTGVYILNGVKVIVK